MLWNYIFRIWFISGSLMNSFSLHIRKPTICFQLAGNIHCHIRGCEALAPIHQGTLKPQLSHPILRQHPVNEKFHLTYTDRFLLPLVCEKSFWFFCLTLYLKKSFCNFQAFKMWTGAFNVFTKPINPNHNVNPNINFKCKNKYQLTIWGNNFLKQKILFISSK